MGREQCDYTTLIEALRDVPLPCVIVPGSSWSHRSPESSWPGQSRADYAASVNSILKAMSSERAVVASKTPGLADYVEDGQDGQDGRRVAAGDPLALRAVTEEVWEDTAQAERLGRAGRNTVEHQRTIEHFNRRVTESIASVV